jgi:hypothetical protein
MYFIYKNENRSFKSVENYKKKTKEERRKMEEMT